MVGPSERGKPVLPRDLGRGRLPGRPLELEGEAARVRKLRQPVEDEDVGGARGDDPRRFVRRAPFCCAASSTTCAASGPKASLSVLGSALRRLVFLLDGFPFMVVPKANVGTSRRISCHFLRILRAHCWPTAGPVKDH